MSIPNPYPNIADKEINDVKTWSSAKIINELQPALDTEITCKETYEGNIVTFNNLDNEEITSLDCEILPIQEGTGTPSPSNPRPISGTSVLDIKHSGADTSDYDTTSVALGQEIMGGTADVVGGVGSKTHGFLTLNGSENWVNVGGSYPQAFQLDTGITNAFQGIIATQKANNISNLYPWSTNEVENYAIRWQVGNQNGRLFVYDNNYSSNLAGFKQHLSDNNLQIVYLLATPTDFTFTGQPINSYLGVNNIWCDTGDIKVTTVETETIGNILKERGILP